jgi:hypothetical protein
MAELQEFAKNVWVVDGPMVRDAGMMFTTRMTIVKLMDGSLWVESPVPVSYDTLRRMNDLGRVKYLLAGTPRHVWRLEGWHTLFPEAELWTSRETSFTLTKGELPLSGILGDSPQPGWRDDLDQLAFKGSPLIQEILFLHRESRTLILDDLIQTHQLQKGRPFHNLLLRLSDAIYPHGGVGIDIRLSFTHRNLARQSLEKLLSWDFDKLIIAHGPCLDKGAVPFVERAFRWLKH